MCGCIDSLIDDMCASLLGVGVCMAANFSVTMPVDAAVGLESGGGAAVDARRLLNSEERGGSEQQ